MIKPISAHGLLFLIEMPVVHGEISSLLVHLFDILVEVKITPHGIGARP